MSNATLVELLVSIVLASLGGVVRRLVESEKNPRQKRTHKYYIVGALISMFVGGVAWLLCKTFSLTEFPTAALSAIAGYGGSPILDKIQKVAEKKVEDSVGYNKDSKSKEEK